MRFLPSFLAFTMRFQGLFSHSSSHIFLSSNKFPSNSGGFWFFGMNGLWLLHQSASVGHRWVLWTFVELTFRKDQTWSQHWISIPAPSFTEWHGSGHLHLSVLECLSRKGNVCQLWLRCISNLFAPQVADSQLVGSAGFWLGLATGRIWQETVVGSVEQQGGCRGPCFPQVHPLEQLSLLWDSASESVTLARLLSLHLLFFIPRCFPALANVCAASISPFNCPWL